MAFTTYGDDKKRMLKQRSISTTDFLMCMILVSVLIYLFGYLWIRQEYSDSQSESKALEDAQLAYYKELISNCLKHAFPGRGEGNILLRFKQVNQETLELEVRDDGIGVPTDFSFENSASFGSDLVKTLVGDLHGRVHVLRNRGTAVRISFRETDRSRRGGEH